MTPCRHVRFHWPRHHTVSNRVGSISVRFTCPQRSVRRNHGTFASAFGVVEPSAAGSRQSTAASTAAPPASICTNRRREGSEISKSFMGDHIGGTRAIVGACWQAKRDTSTGGHTVYRLPAGSYAVGRRFRSL